MRGNHRGEKKHTFQSLIYDQWFLLREALLLQLSSFQDKYHFKEQIEKVIQKMTYTSETILSAFISKNIMINHVLCALLQEEQAKK